MPEAQHLTVSDAFMLAALAPFPGPQSLRFLIGGFQSLLREDPTYEQLSYGIARLVSAGLVHVSQHADGQAFEATSRARGIYPWGLGEIEAAFKLAGVLGVDTGAGEPGDTSGSGCPGLSRQDVEEALAETYRWVSRGNVRSLMGTYSASAGAVAASESGDDGRRDG